MSKILIAGDSWGCGEWNVDCSEILHAGLCEFLQRQGHTVNNISKGGCSNLDSVFRMRSWFERSPHNRVEHVFVFQTEYTRDAKHAEPSDWESDNIVDFSDRLIGRFYSRLSEISVAHHCAIHIIGGCSDTLRFDDMTKDYAGCDIACQSFVNLVLNDDPGIQDPVLSWYDRHSHDLVERFKNKSTDVAVLLTLLDQGFERENLLRENPQWFWPDGSHANRAAHQKLHDFVRQKYSL